MRVGYILAVFPALTQTFILNELIELLAEGHEVYIFSLLRPKDRIVQPEIQRYGLLKKTCYLPSYAGLGLRLLNPQLYGTLFNKAYPARRVRSRLYGVAAADYLSGRIAGLNLDILHAHFYGLTTFVSMLLSQRTELPFTFICHGRDIFVEPKPKVLRRHMEAASKVITPSHYTVDYLHNLTGVDKRKIEVIRACPDIDKLKTIRRREEGLTILTVARLAEDKGIDYGIMAVKEVAREFPQIEYRIVGPGPLEQRLKMLVKSLDLEGNVTFLGALDSDSVGRELAKATIFILPCIKARDGNRDVCPLALLEAMYMRVPVISTNMASIPELIEDGKEGLLVEQQNVEQLASAIRMLLHDKGLRTAMGENGRAKVEKEFNIHKEVDKLVHLWEAAKGSWYIER
jgi:colanic acid/amylovoran biosynthesis glycosyltransferase